jgi:hypothetical protein
MKDFDKPEKGYHESKIETVVMCWPSNASISFGVPHHPLRGPRDNPTFDSSNTVPLNKLRKQKWST